MVEIVKKQPHWWWFEGHNSPRRSPWLQSTLAELDEKTKAVLKLIEEDADSFAQRVEMYYKKRPELINMVEELYRAHRSLAERHDQVSGPRAVTTLGNPLLTRYRAEKVTSIVDESYDTYSETFDPSEFGDSEVEDPEQEDETRVNKEMEEVEVSSGVCNEEVTKLREYVEGLKKENKIQKDQLMQKDEERKDTSVGCIEELMKLRKDLESLKEENKIQKDQLIQKDEEKREVIRQLSLAVEMLKEENFNLKKCIARNSNKKSSRPLEFNKLKGVIWGKLFSGSSKSETSIVAL